MDGTTGPMKIKINTMTPELRKVTLYNSQKKYLKARRGGRRKRRRRRIRSALD
jgi:hypothetical protein